MELLGTEEILYNFNRLYDATVTSEVLKCYIIDVNVILLINVYL